LQAVATRRVPNIQFHSLHVGKSCANHVTKPNHNRNIYVLVLSKSDQRRLRKTLHKQTDRQTDTRK